MRANELGELVRLRKKLWKICLCIGAGVVATEVGEWVYVSKALSLVHLTLSWLWVGMLTAWILAWRECEKSDKAC